MPVKTQEMIDVYLQSCRSRQLSAHTIYGYAWALHKLRVGFPDELPNDIEQIEALFRTHADMAAASRKGLWRKLRTFWIWLEKRGYAENVMALMPSPRLPTQFPVTLNTIEIALLLNAVNTERDYLMLCTFLDNGMRLGEMAAMRTSHIDTIEGSIRVTGKTGERFVPLSPAIAKLLIDQSVDGAIWTGSKGMLTKWGIAQVVRRCMRHAGLTDKPKNGAHTLRHTFAHQYILNGGDVFSLQRIMGHSKVETTMIYVNMSVSTIKDQHSRYSPTARLIERGDFDVGMQGIADRANDRFLFAQQAKGVASGVSRRKPMLERRRRVKGMLAKGMSNTEIAAREGVDRKTIYKDVRSITG